MNNLKNKVQLIGHLGMDPEIKAINGKSKLAKFRLATNETYKNDKGEKVEETQWHNLIAWGTKADFAEKYLTKGIEVVVEGKLINKSYTDKNDVKRYITEVMVSEMVIISRKAK
ncbi:MAG: single-stranded DNA-binding protein [Chitinophagales bacterium]